MLNEKRSLAQHVNEWLGITLQTASFGLYAAAMHFTFYQVSSEYRSACQRLMQTWRYRVPRTRLTGLLARDVTDALNAADSGE